MIEEKDEIVLNEKIVEKLKAIISEQAKLQQTLIDIVQTILDYEGQDGKWDFKKENSNIDITTIVRIKDETGE